MNYAEKLVDFLSNKYFSAIDSGKPVSDARAFNGLYQIHEKNLSFIPLDDFYELVRELERANLVTVSYGGDQPTSLDLSDSFLNQIQSNQ